MPQRPSAKFNIYADTVDVSDIFELIATSETAGAERLDIAQLFYKGAILEDFSPASLMGLEIEVERDQTSEIIHWGKVQLVSPNLSASNGEILTVVSRSDHFLLGGRVDGYWVHDPRADAPKLVYGDLVFNPEIDGKVYGNLNDTKLTGAGDPLFLDPESVRTTAAQTYQGADAIFWALSGAVYYLLWSLNTAETYITNLSLVALQAIFDDANDLVKNVRIPRGSYLTQALDTLLIPMGYHWKINRTGFNEREFGFFKRGTGGSLVSVTHQRAGSALDVVHTNVVNSAVQMDVSRLANDVTIEGGFKEYEVTVELLRAWPSVDDSLTMDELRKDHDDWEDNKNVWRKWVLNEAGDYIGLRTEIDGLWTSAFRTAIGGSGLDIEDQFVARRRKMLPCLTLNADNSPIGNYRGYQIEYSDPVNDGQWLPIGNWACEILEQECGIYFDGEEAPEELVKQGSDAKVRITFTLVADVKVQGYAAPSSSPNGDTVPVVLDMPQKFRYREVTTLSQFSGGSNPTLAQDDTTAIQDYAEYIRDLWDLMDVGGTIELEGLDNSYKIGDRVSGILLKNISFEGKASSGAYPQIVGIERDVARQSTTLHLQRVSEALRPETPRRR